MIHLTSGTLQRIISIILLLILFLSSAIPNEFVWDVGMSKQKITPTKSMWLGGYASRDHAYESIRHDVWIKALAIRDQQGALGVLVCMDLISIPKDLSDRVRNRLQEEHGIAKKQIILNVSHTHTGPEVRNNVWALTDEEFHKINTYVERLEEQIITLVRSAMTVMEPCRLFAGNGVTRFQVNRRNNKERELRSYTELQGPNDYAVPVLKVLDAQGDLKAMVFGYACHPTVMNDYQISGDYPGFAQIELEKKYPEAMALFFQGAGADQNPLPRRSAALAEQYGRELAAAVMRVMDEKMIPLSSRLAVSFSEIEIGMKEAPPTQHRLKTLLDDENQPAYLKYRWGLLYQKLQRGKSLPSSHPYPIQVWLIGEQPIFTFGGELVIGYAIELKRIFGDQIFVMGYSNDVMGYIPTLTVLTEGGYEGNRSPYPDLCPWDDEVESLIIAEARKLADQIGVQVKE